MSRKQTAGSNHDWNQAQISKSDGPCHPLLPLLRQIGVEELDCRVKTCWKLQGKNFTPKTRNFCAYIPFLVIISLCKYYFCWSGKLMNNIKVICNDPFLYQQISDKSNGVENYSTWQHVADLQYCLPSSITLLSGSHFALKCIFLLQTLLCQALLDNRANCPFT